MMLTNEGGCLWLNIINIIEGHDVFNIVEFKVQSTYFDMFLIKNKI